MSIVDTKVQSPKDPKKIAWLKIAIISILAVATLFIWYLTIPAFFIWWLVTTKRISKKAKIISGTVAGVLFLLTSAGIGVAYYRDPTPSFQITEPTDYAIIKGQAVTIKGTYQPNDRTVWINDKEITASDGKFEIQYNLVIGTNAIEIKVGNWKRTSQKIHVTRTYTEEEIAAMKKAEAERLAREEAARQADEAQRKADEEARLAAEEEAKKAEVEAAEARRIEDEQAQKDAEERAKIEEQERIKREAEEKVKAEAENKQREQDDIKRIVEDQLKGDNNLDKPRLREVRVSEAFEEVSGGWTVFVKYNASQNWNDEMTRKGIEVDMSELYTALYTSGKDIRLVSIEAYLPLVDQYGNESDGMVYRSILRKSEAQKVNWKIADEAYFKLDILPGIWETVLVHPAIR